MPVPDKVIFGPKPEQGEYTYGDVRKLDETGQFEAIKLRVDTFFVNQVSELGEQEDGSKKVYSPFPLFLLSCVGVETVGRLFYGAEPREGRSKEDIQRDGFLKACGKIHQKFGRQLPKKEKAAYDMLWGKDKHQEITSLAVLFYKLGRHTMMHGYQARGVYLTAEVEDFEVSNGALVLNPWGFWKLFLLSLDQQWEEFFKITEQNNPQLVSMKLYRDSLLN
jgi:hypothetical protein